MTSFYHPSHCNSNPCKESVTCSFATALTGLMLLIMGVYGLALLILTPFTLLGALFYTIAGSLVIYWSMKAEIVKKLPKNIRWMLYEASTWELIMHSKTAWKLYGLVLATFALGKEELREYLSQNTSIVSELSMLEPYPSKQLQQQYYLQQPAISSEDAIPPTSMVTYQSKAKKLNLPAEAYKSMDLLKFAAKKTALKAFQSVDKEVTTKLMEVALDSCKKQLTKYMTSVLKRWYHMLLYEAQGGSMSTATLSLTMLINGTIAMNSKFITQVMRQYLPSSTAMFLRTMKYHKFVKYLTLPSAAIAATMLSVRVGRYVIEGDTPLLQIEDDTSGCNAPEASSKVEQNNSSTVILNLASSMEGSLIFQQSGKTLKELWDDSCHQAVEDVDESFKKLLAVVLVLVNIVSYRMCTIPHKYAWLRSVLMQRLFQLLQQSRDEKH